MVFSVFCYVRFVMKKKVPVNVGFFTLLTIEYTAASIISILHRIVGVLLIIPLVWFLTCVCHNVTTPASFMWVLERFGQTDYKVFTQIFLAMFFFHSFAGIRHLLMDCGLFKDFYSARITTFVVFFMSIVYIGFGIFLCF